MNPQSTAAAMTILLVDDHDDTRAALKEWFELDGYTVLEAPNKTAGMSLGREQRFDILVCDLQLPDGNGWDLMATLRAEKAIVGIAMSGHCAPADVARSKAAGFLMHLVKPIPPEDMEAAFAAAWRALDRSPPIGGS